MDTDADLKGVVVEMAENIAENLPPSEQFGFHHVIKMVRDGTVSANFLSQMLKEMKKYGNRVVKRWTVPAGFYRHRFVVWFPYTQ